MTSSEKGTYGLALTIMEVQRLARNGVLRIGDRIKLLSGARDVAEIIDLAPDLGEAQEDYLLAKLAPGAMSTHSLFGPDRPHLRLLSRGDITSFHLMRRDAKDLLEDRARDFGIELADPEWEDVFDMWQCETRARGLDSHATRLRRECRLPPPDVARVASIEQAMANAVKVRQSIGTPAYGWAVVFKSALSDNALKDGSELKARVKASLEDLRARPFAAAAFFAVEGSVAAALAKDLRLGPEAHSSVPLEAMAWLNQIGHQHFRGEPPTPEAFDRSLTWLAHVIGSDWAASCLEVYCKGAVRLDARPSIGWPTAADLAGYTCSVITPAEPDTEAEPEPVAPPEGTSPDQETKPDSRPSEPTDDAQSASEADETPKK